MSFRTLIGFALAIVVRLWLVTLRVRVLVHPALDLAGDRPIVLGFWHGQQLLLLGARRRRLTATLVSLSRDGELQSGVMRGLGFLVERGSSSRGGARGLRSIVRRVCQGADAAFAVDGPRGPRARAKPGAALAAAAAGARLVPTAAFASRALVLERTWDCFEIPLPFARVVVVLGAPLDAAEAACRPELISFAIESALDEARRHTTFQRGAFAPCPPS